MKNKITGEMTMELGSGIAIAGSVVGVAAVLIKWIGKNSQPQCNLHAMIESQIADMKSWLQRVEEKLDKVIEKI